MVNVRMYADLDRDADEVELVVFRPSTAGMPESDSGHASRLIGTARAAAVAMLGGEATMQPLAV